MALDARITPVPMREECKHYQSRTYSSGEVARFCELDLAPEAPWRCPENCPRYERRFADVGWEHGTLVEPPVEDEPSGDPGEIAGLLDSAEDIVNAIAPEAWEEAVRKQAEEDRKRDRGRKWPWRRKG
jgi:hypothetical protein